MPRPKLPAEVIKAHKREYQRAYRAACMDPSDPIAAAYYRELESRSHKAWYQRRRDAFFAQGLTCLGQPRRNRRLGIKANSPAEYVRQWRANKRISAAQTLSVSAGTSAPVMAGVEDHSIPHPL